jgi:hypothetical protein
MNTLAKAAAAAGSVVAASAVGLALVLPAQHGASVATRPAGTTGAHAAQAGHAGRHGQQSATGSQAGGAGTAGASGSAGTTAGAGRAGSTGGAAAAGGAGSTGGTTSTGSGTGTGAGAGTPAGTVVSSGSGTPAGTGTTTGAAGSGTNKPAISKTSTTPSGLHLPQVLNGGQPHTNMAQVTAIPSPAGTIGDPGVACLEGYVWRRAYSGDYVCVTPATRAQAAADNAAALSRVQPGGGAYGQYTCQQGYVWRQVVPDDYTCVTAAVRAQAAYDNSQAGHRAALLSLWVTDWTPPSSTTSNCSGDVCTTTEGGWDGPNFQVNGDLFNYGQVQLQIRSNSGTLLWWANVNAGSYPGYPGGAFGAQTPIGDCSSDPATMDNDYVVAYDLTSGRWSNRLPIDSDCASF